LDHIRFGIKQHVNLIALSFIKSGNDLDNARNIINELGENPFLVAKIEKDEAVRNIDEIIGKADGIMIARGDLGVEIGLEKSQ